MSYSRPSEEEYSAEECLEIIKEITRRIKIEKKPFNKEITANAAAITQTAQFALNGDIILQRAIVDLQYFNPNTKEEYLKWLEFNAKQGHAYSLIDLAACIREGKYGVTKNIHRCVDLLQIVIESENPAARKVAQDYMNRDAELKLFFHLLDINDVFKNARNNWMNETNYNETMAMFYYILNHHDTSGVVELCKSYVDEDHTLVTALEKYERQLKNNDSVVHTHNDYFKLTNKHNLSIQKVATLTQLKKEISVLLKDPKSILYRHINNLPTIEKQKFISALIQCDSVTIASFLSSPLHASSLSFSITDLQHITEHTRAPTDRSPLLNDTAKRLILTMLTDAEKNYLSINVRTRLLRSALQSIPDKLISLATKRKICRQIDREVSENLEYIAYDETLKPLAKNRFSGHISEKEFLSALRYPALNISDFIVLTTGFLTTTLEKSHEPTLQLIREAYLSTDYERAIDLIRQLATESKSVISHASFDVIQSIHPRNVTINDNDSRRFFENRLSQITFGQFKNFNNINKLTEFLNLDPVNTYTELKSVILHLGSIEDKDLLNRMKELKRNSHLYITRNTWLKDGVNDRREEIHQGIIGASIYTRNLGVMKSIAPNFPDEISDEEIRNRIPDVKTIAPDDTTSYSASNPRIVMASSLSGHCYFYVAIMEQYLIAHQGDLDLNDVMNDFARAIVSTYITHGYHSYFEMLDVLQHDTSVSGIFKFFNVNIQLSNQPLKEAFIDTQEYAKKTCLVKAVHDELFRHTNRKYVNQVINDIPNDSSFLDVSDAKKTENDLAQLSIQLSTDGKAELVNLIPDNKIISIDDFLNYGIYRCYNDKLIHLFSRESHLFYTQHNDLIFPTVEATLSELVQKDITNLREFLAAPANADYATTRYIEKVIAPALQNKLLNFMYAAHFPQESIPTKDDLLNMAVKMAKQTVYRAILDPEIAKYISVSRNESENSSNRIASRIYIIGERTLKDFGKTHTLAKIKNVNEKLSSLRTDHNSHKAIAELVLLLKSIGLEHVSKNKLLQIIKPTSAQSNDSQYEPTRLKAGRK